MAQTTTDLVIKGFSAGIGASPHVGFGDIRNLDIHTIPGVVRANSKTTKRTGTTVTALPKWIVQRPSSADSYYSVDSGGVVYSSSSDGLAWAAVTGKTFTVTIASPAVFSCTAHGLAAGDTLKFTTTGALPTGLTVGVTYYVIAAGLTADAFEVSTSNGGSAVNTSGTQSGTHSMLVTGGAGQGLQIWKDYLFVARDTKLDLYGPLSSSPKWTFNWNTIDSDVAFHPMIVSNNDGKLYGGAGRYIYSLDEVSTFSPTSGATYTFTQQALDLPSTYRVKCLAELGNDIQIGTWVTPAAGYAYDFKVATIFPWDRSSPSFSQPMNIGKCGVNQMIVINNILYIQAGVDGAYYKSNGVSFAQIAQIPVSIIDTTKAAGQYIWGYPGAIVENGGRLFVGLSCDGDRGNTIAGMGVWSIDINTQGAPMTFEYVISTGSYGGSSLVQIGALCNSTPLSNQALLIGWRDASTYGIDAVVTNRYTSYAAYFESPLYRVGTNLNKRQFTEGEFQLQLPLATGQGVKVEYRTDVTSSYTTIGTYDYATLGAVMSHNFTPGIPACEYIQLKVSLTCNTGSELSPQLTTVTLR